MQAAKPTRDEVIFAAEMTLRMLKEQEVESPEVKKSFDEVIGHIKHIIRPKYEEK